MGTVHGAVISALGYNILMRYIVDDVAELAGGPAVLSVTVIMAPLFFSCV